MIPDELVPPRAFRQAMDTNGDGSLSLEDGAKWGEWGLGQDVKIPVYDI